jgi:NitT/TauT family transport system permease protein
MVTAVMGVAMYVCAVTLENRTTGWATRGQNDQQQIGFGGA